MRGVGSAITPIVQGTLSHADAHGATPPLPDSPVRAPSSRRSRGWCPAAAAQAGGARTPASDVPDRHHDRWLDADWDRSFDFYVHDGRGRQAGKATSSPRPIRATTAPVELMVVFVEAIRSWAIVPSNGDNYVKIGQTDKLVDGSFGQQRRRHRTSRTSARPDGRRRSICAAGFVLGDGGLNIHAEVDPGRPCRLRPPRPTGV